MSELARMAGSISQCLKADRILDVKLVAVTLSEHLMGCADATLILQTYPMNGSPQTRQSQLNRQRALA